MKVITSNIVKINDTGMYTKCDCSCANAVGADIQQPKRKK